jgi:hypothetical protein
MRLARMRGGQDMPELVPIPSMEGIRAAMVPLSEAEAQAGLIAAAALNAEDNAAGLQARNRIAIQHDVWHSLREPDDTSQRIWPTVEEMVGDLAPGDVDNLHDQLSLLMDYASPAIDGVTDEELNDLKKAFGEIDLSALTGRRWAAVKLCVSNLFPELLLVRSLGSTSTDNVTETKEKGAST